MEYPNDPGVPHILCCICGPSVGSPALPGQPYCRACARRLAEEILAPDLEAALGLRPDPAHVAATLAAAFAAAEALALRQQRDKP